MFFHHIACMSELCFWGKSLSDYCSTQLYWLILVRLDQIWWRKYFLVFKSPLTDASYKQWTQLERDQLWPPRTTEASLNTEVHFKGGLSFLMDRSRDSFMSWPARGVAVVRRVLLEVMYNQSNSHTLTHHSSFTQTSSSTFFWMAWGLRDPNALRFLVLVSALWVCPQMKVKCD